MERRLSTGLSLRGALIGRTAGLAIILLTAADPAQSSPFSKCLPAPSQHSATAEEQISIQTPDGRISGSVASPAGAAPKALALMLHGYTGSRNEIPVARGEGMFARAARAFAETGIATLRIDFIGSGRSDGEWADTRFSTQARDATRAAKALREKFPSPNLQLGVLGYSQGGLVALRSGASDDPFDKLALWNPVMDPMTTYGKIFGPETIVEAAQRFRQNLNQAIVDSTRLRPGFFAEIATSDPMANAARLDDPILIVTGKRDPLVVEGATLANQIKTQRSAATTILDLDAGHDLGAIHEPELLDRVIACTAGFLLADHRR